MSNTFFQVRVTGVLIEDDSILLVKQHVTDDRAWSLPGGRMENGELTEEALKRELLEETGLLVEIEKLLYVCEKPEAEPPLIHMTFLLKKTGGAITLPSNEFDDNPINDVRMIPIEELREYGFTRKFKNLAQEGFPDAGNYMGLKQNIGL